MLEFVLAVIKGIYRGITFKDTGSSDWISGALFLLSIGAGYFI